MKNTKKYIILTTTLLLMATANAQVFLIDEDYLYSERIAQNQTTPLVPYQGGDSDQTLNYAPLGGGWLVLAGFGTIYLMRKRKKDNE